MIRYNSGQTTNDNAWSQPHEAWLRRNVPENVGCLVKCWSWRVRRDVFNVLLTNVLLTVWVYVELQRMMTWETYLG